MKRSRTPTRPTPPVRLRARRPDDLLALVPYLLGFQPTESLVAVLVENGRVLLSARIDLPKGGGEGLVACTKDLVHRHAPSALVLIVYSADRERAERLLARHLDALSGVVPISDALLVDGHRWWSLTCTSGCCPAEGTPYAPEVHPFAAEAVYAGLITRASREEVAAEVAGPGPAGWDAPRRTAAELRDGLRRLGHAGRRRQMASDVVEGLTLIDTAGIGTRLDAPTEDGTCLDGTDAEPPGLSERRLVRLALLAREIPVRDVACALITREQTHGHLALWQRVVALVPPELAVAPLCLLGVAAWAGGEGALLNCCCNRVRALDSAYSMGQLLADVSSRALPPSFWDALSAQLRDELGLAVG